MNAQMWPSATDRISLPVAELPATRKSLCGLDGSMGPFPSLSTGSFMKALSLHVGQSCRDGEW